VAALGRGKLAIVFAGKAHPRDEDGKQAIRHIVEVSRRLGGDVPIVWLPGYDVELARSMVSGADVWLNTPLPPLEASGTSGMKAAHNGVPSLSVLDGWWLEGCVEGVTGWGIGGEHDGRSDTDDAAELYAKLESFVLQDDQRRVLLQGLVLVVERARHATELSDLHFDVRVHRECRVRRYQFEQQRCDTVEQRRGELSAAFS
jgi:glucan phosphorylase